MKRSTIVLSLIEVTKSRLPGVAWIDLNRGQLNTPEAHYPFPKPAILIHLGEREWEVTGKGVQRVEGAEVKITLVQDNYSQTFDGASNQEEAMQAVLDFPEQVYLALQDVSGEGFSSLNRVSEGETLFDNVIIVDEITFHTTIIDTVKLDAGSVTLTNVGLQVEK